LAQLPYAPYPVQEEALLAWFTSEQGVMVCAPTGTGKTVIAEAALFEALHTGRTAYYTTPLIALTEQKFAEMQQHAVRWGFRAEDVGLVTGNRRVNPQARVLVVVAEILLNRLLHPEAFAFDDVGAVVMDEFHSFNDPERGIVWELTLALLPRHVRLLLLSATVGNAAEFMGWLQRAHGRKLELVQGSERRVPLVFQWVEDELLVDQVAKMAQGSPETRLTPALLFCFNREECWDVADRLRSHNLSDPHTRRELHSHIEQYDWSLGAGGKLKQLLLRGVGVHHAGLMPRYRRIVEELFVRKLLAACVCTETLAAGINLPARSVVMTSLVKGPPGKQRLIDASTAHQIFGRAGRPQFDDRGYVICLAHEDDVRIHRWKKQYEAIPENTRDPALLKAKKALKKKRPTRSDKQTYWNEEQFEKLKAARPANLSSRGQLPWRLLAYLLQISPDVERIHGVLRRRLLPAAAVARSQHDLTRMLLTLESAGYVKLEPPPPPPDEPAPAPPANAQRSPPGTLGALLQAHFDAQYNTRRDEPAAEGPQPYVPQRAYPQPGLERLLAFRSVNPLYGLFLVEHLAMADFTERLQALESVLELPRSLLRQVRVPPPWVFPPGPLQQSYLDEELLRRGLMAAPPEPAADDDPPDELPPPLPPLAEKLRLLFDAQYPHVRDVHTQAVWVAGELLVLGGDFDKYVKSRDLVRQEGIIFRHLLRLILLCGEFAAVTPPKLTSEQWQEPLRELAQQLTESCRQIDPESTDKMIEEAQATDIVAGEGGTP
jgi:superfamily II DNA/RNA helicase